MRRTGLGAEAAAYVDARFSGAVAHRRVETVASLTRAQERLDAVRMFEHHSQT